MAFDVSVTTLLGELSAALREHYLSDELLEHFEWWGNDINKLFQFAESSDIQGEYHYWQVEKYKARPIRASRDITANFSNHARFEVARLAARLSETAANNDFSRFDGSVRTSLFDLERGARDPKQYVINTVPRLTDQLIKHCAESMAIHTMVDESALLATVNSAAKQNDKTTYAAAAATPTNGGTTGIRILITGGSIAFFQPGLVVRIYSGSSATVRVTNAMVTDYNPIDGSIGLKRWDITTRLATTNGNANPENLIGVDTGDTIFISGERNAGMKSIAEWMAPTVTSTPFFGVDRSLPENSYMRPTVLDPGNGSVVPFDIEHLNKLSIALGYVRTDASAAGYISHTTLEIDQSFRNQVGSQNIIQMPTSEQAGVLARYGFEGSVFVHPVIGRIMLKPSALAIANRLMLLKPGDWKRLIARRFKPVPRANAIGDFYDVKASDGTGTLEYQADYFGLSTDICERPNQQAEIVNIAG